MQKNIVKKCLEEIKKKKPNLAYLRGLLESLSEMGETVTLPKDFGTLNNPAISTMAREPAGQAFSKPEGFGPADPYNPNNQDSDLKVALQRKK